MTKYNGYTEFERGMSTHASYRGIKEDDAVIAKSTRVSVHMNM